MKGEWWGDVVRLETVHQRGLYRTMVNIVPTLVKYTCLHYGHSKCKHNFTDEWEWVEEGGEGVGASGPQNNIGQ